MSDEASGTAQCIVVLVTVGSRESALRIGRSLVEEHLAACCNVIPGVTSIYRWEGEICEDEELILVLKTRRSQLDLLKSRVAELHEYEVPEIIALPINDGSAAYLNWVREETSP